MLHNISTKEISTIPNEGPEVYDTSFVAGPAMHQWVSLPVKSFVAYVDAIVEERLKDFFQRKALATPFRNIDDTSASNEIKNYVIQKKAQGTTKLSLIDISESLLLPIEQIEKIMGTYEKEGKVKEVYE